MSSQKVVLEKSNGDSKHVKKDQGVSHKKRFSSRYGIMFTFTMETKRIFPQIYPKNLLHHCEDYVETNIHLTRNYKENIFKDRTL